MVSVLLGLALAVGAGCTASSSEPAGGAPTTSDGTATTVSLSDQQLRANVDLAEAQAAQARQTTESGRAADSFGRQLLTPLASLGGVLLTALVAFLAVILPLSRQRKSDREQREAAAKADVHQREKDRIQRFDAGFAAAVTALGSTSPATQAGGAVALQSYLRPDLGDFHEQVFLVVRANLDDGIDHANAVRRPLVAALCRALRLSCPRSATTPPRAHSASRDDGPDLTRAWLRGGDFRGLDLSSADLAFSDVQSARFDGAFLRRSWGWQATLDGASFRGADLEECRFQECSALKSVFDGARLVSGRFERARLDGARFRDAQLQGAHFDDASLCGADFRSANLDDTYFRGSMFDDPALESLLLSTTWRPLRRADLSTEQLQALREAMLRFIDEDTVDRLVALAGVRQPDPGSAPEDAPTPKLT